MDIGLPVRRGHRRPPRPSGSGRSGSPPEATARRPFVRLALGAFGALAAGPLAGWGCGLRGWGSPPEERIEVVVDSSWADATVVRIDGRPIGEIPPLGHETWRVARLGIAGRRVSVCAHPIGTSRAYCAAGGLVVPLAVRRIRIQLQRGGLVFVTVL